MTEGTGKKRPRIELKFESGQDERELLPALANIVGQANKAKMRERELRVEIKDLIARNEKLDKRIETLEKFVVEQEAQYAALEAQLNQAHDFLRRFSAFGQPLDRR